ncbi:MAG: NAD(P)H-dependent oxidoreductase [Acidaminococcaceae bacterium]|nr:NAD(P)H-dependent oxidoreductase [Acidaminococcaceae bacterium]
MKKVLIVSGHTDLNNSFANKIILEKLAKDLPEAVFDYLDREYPDFAVDVKAEQKKLVEADIVVLQFPVFWYSYPSIMHRWMENVFEHGFSHGSEGKALQGKKLVASFTTGAPEEMYVKSGPQLYPIDELVIPAIKSTANLCSMVFAGYIYTGGVSYASRPDSEQVRVMKAKAEKHAERLEKLLNEI